MSRIPRNRLQGKKLFHIMVQGINKESIFMDDDEKQHFLFYMTQRVVKYSIKIIAYCVMTNHVHMLLKVDAIDDLSRFMQELNSSYAQFYNKKKDRVGHVFRDRYKLQIILDRAHFKNCIVYIHNNPVKANICQLATQYEYSSYNDFFKQDQPAEVKDLFLDVVDFKNAHNIDKMKKINFLEDEEDFDVIIKNEVANYLKKQKKSLVEMNYYKDYDEIILLLKGKYGLSSRKIAEYLDINREIVRKVLRKKNKPVPNGRNMSKKPVPFGEFGENWVERID